MNPELGSYDIFPSRSTLEQTPPPPPFSRAPHHLQTRRVCARHLRHIQTFGGRDAPPARMACYYLVISSTHLSNGHFRRVKGVFRGPLCHGSDSPEQPERPDGCSLEDLKALYYCELCDKQYLRHQEFDNHINSYDHAHKQRLKELKQREFARNVASKSWKDQRKQEKALRRLHQQAQLQQETHRVSGRNCGVRSAVRVVNKSRETERRDLSPEDKPFKLRDTPSASHTLGCCQKDSCGSLNQLSSTLSVSRVGDSLQDSYAQRGKVGGRLGVSFCFSRKGPRLEPSASVFSDHEEEEREKREQIRERIKKIIKDIDREIEESNQERKYTEIIQDDATMSVDKMEDAGTQREIADSPSGEKEEQEDAGKAEEHRCVLGKDGATELSWPVSLLRFTKSEPHISYSCNPKQLQPGPERQEGKLSPSTDEQSPCLSNTFREENGPERTEAETKVAGAVDTKSEAHLFLENKRLSSPDGEGRMPSIDARAVAHSFVPSDSSDTNSWCPQEERLRGARGIREGASAVVSSKLEPVTRASPQSVCIRLSRCDCGRQVAGKSGPKILKADTTVTAPFEKRIRINKLGKKKRGKRGNASNKKQKCKLRSVVMTVPNVTDKKMFVNRRESKTGGKRRRNEGNGFLSGRCAAKPLSIRRNFTLGSASEHCSTYSPQTRLPADRDPDIQRRWERNVVTSQWQTHNSIHAFAPAHCKKLFWEKGHHGNPRSFIDCSYPDNSCNSSPARKRKIHHRENIHSKRSSLRHCEEERGQTGSRDRCLVSATEHSEWLRGNSLSGTVAEDGLFKADLAPRSRAAKYNWVSSPCPSRRYRSGRTPEEMEWDGCSLDRWTWGSTDSWDDRDTQRRKTGPQGESDRSENSSFTRKGSDNRRSRHSPSPEWWMRHSEGGLDLSPAEDNACHSPCSYSPMSSTSMSEMSWEWSRSSTCSSFTLNKKPSNPNRGNPDTPEHLPEEDRKQSKPAPASLSCKSIKDVPHNVLEPTVKQDSSPSQPQVTTASPATPVLALPESVQRKITKTLLFPLIGKRPAIQKKERKRRKIQEKSEEKASGDKSLAIVGGQKSLQANEAKFSPEELKAADKQTMDEAAQPISFSVEEIDKYRQLQEEARKHMQKVLERTQESAHEDSTHSTTSERYRTPHMDTLQVGLLHRGGVANVGQRDNKIVIPVSLSPALSNLHHVILHSAHTVPSSAATSPPPGAHPHPPQLSLSPTHPSLTHYLHLSPLSISSLLPSVFLSQHPIHLLRPCPAFTPLDPFSALQMQPLNPQPFMDRTWPVRFQQKAL